MCGMEENTGTTVLKKGTKLYHGSDKKIKNFLSYGVPESTCFFTDNRCTHKYVYEITTGKDRNRVACYGSEEVRFDLRDCDSIIEIKTGKKVNIEDY